MAQASTDILTRIMPYESRYVRNILLHVKPPSVIQRMIRIQRKHELDPDWENFSHLLETVADIHGHGHAYWAKVERAIINNTSNAESTTLVFFFEFPY